jgi:hypothetical protein
MKKLILPLIFLALGYAIFFFLFDKKNTKKIPGQAKVSKPFIGKHEFPADKSENDFVESEEVPTDYKVNDPPKKRGQAPPITDRKYIGADFKTIDEPPSNIIYENTYNPNWEDLLIKEFFDGERPDGNIEIKRLDSFVYIKGGSGLYVEKVSVNVTAPKEMAGTFFAYVNSGTGEIIHAWEGQEELPTDEVSGIPDEGTVDLDNQALDIPESTVEEGIEFTEEDIGSAPSEDTFYPDYN